MICLLMFAVCMRDVFFHSNCIMCYALFIHCIYNGPQGRQVISLFYCNVLNVLSIKNKDKSIETMFEPAKDAQGTIPKKRPH